MARKRRSLWQLLPHTVRESRQAEREGWWKLARGDNRTVYERGPHGVVKDWEMWGREIAERDAKAARKTQARFAAGLAAWLEDNRDDGPAALPAGPSVPEQLALPPGEARHMGRYAVAVGPDVDGQDGDVPVAWDGDRYSTENRYAHEAEVAQWLSETEDADAHWDSSAWLAERDDIAGWDTGFDLPADAEGAPE
jgi:hypothetical protein